MMRYRVWWLLLAAVLLAGCSGDSEQPEGGVPGSDKPTPSVPDATEIPLQLVSATRALDPSAVSPAGESHDPIQMFLMSGDAESTITHLAEGQFVYDATASPQWSSTIGLKNTYNCIYGFSPATAASAEISLPTEKTSYKDGAVLTLTNINPVMGSDLCVIVGVSHGTNSTTDDAPAEIPDRGKFYFEKKTNNYITVLLDHLFAKISFCVKIDPDYHNMRAIKVKKIELLSDKTLTAVKVPLTANESDQSPIGTIQYTTNDVASDADLPSGTIYDFTTDTDATHSEGVELPEDDSWTIPGFFAPAGNGDAAIGRHLSVRFTYDVYAYDVFDNNKVRVRENCVAVNSLPHVTIDGADLQRGQSTTITLTVKPTYLYQLSESELDNPKITIGN